MKPNASKWCPNCYRRLAPSRFRQIPLGRGLVHLVDHCLRCERDDSWFRNGPTVQESYFKRREEFADKIAKQPKPRKPALIPTSEMTHAEKNLYIRCRDKGITVAEFYALLELQDGKCAQCLKPDRSGKTLHIDHCHHTGAVRGLLCTRCNTRMGQYDDDPVQLQRAINYLDNPPWEDVHELLTYSATKIAA